RRRETRGARARAVAVCGEHAGAEIEAALAPAAAVRRADRGSRPCEATPRVRQCPRLAHAATVAERARERPPRRDARSPDRDGGRFVAVERSGRARYSPSGFAPGRTARTRPAPKAPTAGSMAASLRRTS